MSVLVCDWFLRFHPNSKVSPDYWAFTRILRFHPITEVSPEYWVFTRILGFYPNTCFSPDYWGFTQILGFHLNTGLSPYSADCGEYFPPTVCALCSWDPFETLFKILQVPLGLPPMTVNVSAHNIQATTIWQCLFCFCDRYRVANCPGKHFW